MSERNERERESEKEREREREGGSEWLSEWVDRNWYASTSALNAIKIAIFVSLSHSGWH